MSLAISANIRRASRAPFLIRNMIAAGVVSLAMIGGAVARDIASIAPDSDSTAAVLPSSAQPDAHVFIQLSGPPAVQVYASAAVAAMGAAPGAPINLATAPPAVIAAAVAASRTQIQANVSEQASFVSALQASGIKHQEIYRVQRAMNGVAVIVPRSQLAALRAMPGVTAVTIIRPAHPTSAVSVPFINAPQVWQGLTSTAADGTGIKIGIIDTGIDYLHADFGGTGLLADYTGLNTTLPTPFFPSAKVVGGTDLVGDNYNAAGTGAQLIPVPDPNPMDCNEHGSHVAGTAAGFGVTTAGATYAGPYDTTMVPSSLRILPGVAPKALLYAIRVFGCTGSTDVVVQAIDWALDPNGDMNMSDHLDVINMSLGSNNGGLSSLDAMASENASLAGMIVVAASGNANDSYMITSAPAVANRAISVAASWDGGEPAGQVAVTAPPAIVGNYFAVPAAFGPSVTPLSGTVVRSIPNNGCAAFTNAAAITGHIALVDRGTCGFTVKVAFAQAAGATSVIMVDNTPEVPITMGGTDPTITIPSVMISQSDGLLIKAQLGVGVSASLSTVGGGDLMASFSSRGPSSNMPVGLKPDITAPGVNIVSAQSGITAGGIIAGNQSLTISGTSMATPHVAGQMALLKQLHPTWSVEELKALAMNGSIHDLTTSTGGSGLRYGAGRAGAGRIDAQQSATNQVIAYNADGTGQVSVTFPGEIFGATSVIRKIHVVNHGGSTANLTLGIDTVVDNPGVSFSLPGGASLSLAAGASVDIDVQMSGTTNSVRHTRDLTTFTVQGGSPREFLTEETAYMTFSTGGPTTMRVPLYVAPYAAAAMNAGGSLPTGGAALGVVNLTMAGTPVCTATYLPGPPAACNSMVLPTDVVSLVSPFELQVNNPRNGAVPAELDIRYAGVNADLSDGIMNFGFSTWGPFGQPGASVVDIEFTIYDAVGNPTYTIFPTSATVSNVTSNVYVPGIYKWSTGTVALKYLTQLVGGNTLDTRVFQNEALFLSADLTALGLTPGSNFTYSIETYDASGLLESLGPFTYNIAAQGFATDANWLSNDLPGNTIPVAFNTVNLAANGSLGGLLLHHHNKQGTRAEVILVPPATVAFSASTGGAQSTIVGTAFGSVLTTKLTDTFANPVVGAVVTFTLPAAGASGTFPGSVKTIDVLTDGAGVATSPVITANLTAGTYNATATAASVATPATFSLTNLPLPTFALTVNKVGSGSGTVIATSPASTLNCGITCIYVYPQGTVVTLTATDGTGTFAGWSGVPAVACPGIVPTCVVTINAAQAVTATFNDITPPVVTFGLTPPNPSSSPNAQFTFTSNEPLTTTFECSLDGAPFAACVSPVNLVVAPGTHTFSVRGNDNAGAPPPVGVLRNVSVPITYTWTVLAAPPANVPVPTLNEWMLVLLALALASAGIFARRRRE